MILHFNAILHAEMLRSHEIRIRFAYRIRINLMCIRNVFLSERISFLYISECRFVRIFKEYVQFLNRLYNKSWIEAAYS
jgi:hypothetical protein